MKATITSAAASVAFLFYGFKLHKQSNREVDGGYGTGIFALGFYSFSIMAAICAAAFYFVD